MTIKRTASFGNLETFSFAEERPVDLDFFLGRDFFVCLRLVMARNCTPTRARIESGLQVYLRDFLKVESAWGT